MTPQTKIVIAGLVLFVLVMAFASTGSTPAHTLGDLVNLFFETFPG